MVVCYVGSIVFIFCYSLAVPKLDEIINRKTMFRFSVAETENDIKNLEKIENKAANSLLNTLKLDVSQITSHLKKMPHLKPAHLDKMMDEKFLEKNEDSIMDIFNILSYNDFPFSQALICDLDIFKSVFRDGFEIPFNDKNNEFMSSCDRETFTLRCFSEILNGILAISKINNLGKSKKHPFLPKDIGNETKSKFLDLIELMQMRCSKGGIVLEDDTISLLVSRDVFNACRDEYRKLKTAYEMFCNIYYSRSIFKFVNWVNDHYKNDDAEDSDAMGQPLRRVESTPNISDVQPLRPPRVYAKSTISVAAYNRNKASSSAAQKKKKKLVSNEKCSIL